MKTILVTGASSGIGRATALLLATRGHQGPPGATRCSPPRGRQDALRALADSDSLISPLPVDVTRQSSIDEMVNTLLELTDGHGVDVHVNAAGIMTLGLGLSSSGGPGSSVGAVGA